MSDRINKLETKITEFLEIEMGNEIDTKTKDLEIKYNDVRKELIKLHENCVELSEQIKNTEKISLENDQISNMSASSVKKLVEIFNKYKDDDLLDNNSVQSEKRKVGSKDTVAPKKKVFNRSKNSNYE